MNDTKAERTERGPLVEVLEGAGAQVKGNAVKCPFHEDRSASGHLKQSDDGVWRYTCHALSCGVKGDVFDIRAHVNGTAVGDELKASSELFPTSKPKLTKKPAVFPTIAKLKEAAAFSAGKGAQVSDVYQYTNPETGNVDLIVLRIEFDDIRGKQFRQAHPVPDGFVMRAPDGPLPLYNRSRVAGAGRVAVVEGEKAVHALHRVGVVAATSPGGAGKARLADWSPLAGKQVFVWPDNDPEDPKTGKRTGIEHGRQVLEQLRNLEPRPALYWVDPDNLDLPTKGDAADLVERLEHDGMPREEQRQVIENILTDARPEGEYAAFTSILEDAIAGRRYAVPLPWPALSRDARPLFPGAIVLFCGSPGATKSFAVLQSLRQWVNQGIKAAVLGLEEGTPYLLRRAFAQIVENSNLTDDDWCRANPDEVLEAERAAREELKRLEPCIDKLQSDKRPTPDVFLEWIQRKCAAGCRALAIDPVTAMEHSPRSWEDDQRFLIGAKRIVEQHGASLILVSHPRKLPASGRKGALTLDDLAGGTAYSRFTSTILFLVAHKPQDFTVTTSVGMSLERANRTCSVLKARNGPALGNSYAMHFDGGSLCMHELGRICED